MPSRRLQTQAMSLADRTRVEIAFKPVVGEMAVLAYDDPAEALRDAAAFLETALSAVRAEASRVRNAQ